MIDIALFNKLDTNLIVFLILILILVNICFHNRRPSRSMRNYKRLLWSVLLMVVLDTLCWIFLGKPGNAARAFHYWSNFFFLLLNPLPPVFWLLYIIKSFGGGNLSIKRQVLFFAPLAVSLAIMLYSIATGFVFFIDGQNLYHRGPGLFIIAFMNYAVTFASMWYAFVKRKSIRNRVLWIISIYSVLPLMGSILQMFFYGVNTTWPFTVVGLLLAYIFLEIQKNIRDYLTGLINRRQFEEVVHHRIERKGSKAFALVVADMNDFKIINDLYGHDVGDRALQSASLLISRSVGINDTVARFAGDEFVILIDHSDKKVVENVLKRIEKKFSDWNQTSDEEFTLSISTGYAIYDNQKIKSYTALFKAADKMMYQNKEMNKK